MQIRSYTPEAFPRLCQIHEPARKHEPALALYARFGFLVSETVSGAMPGNEALRVTAHILHREQP